jgi:hypothetical protein
MTTYIYFATLTTALTQSLMPSDGMFPLSLELSMHNCAYNSTIICPEQITVSLCPRTACFLSPSLELSMYNCAYNSALCDSNHTLGTCTCAAVCRQSVSSSALCGSNHTLGTCTCAAVCRQNVSSSALCDSNHTLGTCTCAAVCRQSVSSSCFVCAAATL